MNELKRGRVKLIAVPSCFPCLELIVQCSRSALYRPYQHQREIDCRRTILAGLRAFRGSTYLVSRKLCSSWEDLHSISSFLEKTDCISLKACFIKLATLKSSPSSNLKVSFALNWHRLEWTQVYWRSYKMRHTWHKHGRTLYMELESLWEFFFFFAVEL